MSHLESKQDGAMRGEGQKKTAGEEKGRGEGSRKEKVAAEDAFGGVRVATSTDATGSTTPSSSLSFSTPMPAPRSLRAPLFDGERVHDFLETLEQLAEQAGLDQSSLVHYVIRYCTRDVRSVVEPSIAWNAITWDRVKEKFVNFYGSNDLSPQTFFERLQAWALKHGREGVIRNKQEVDRYYREFSRQAMPLMNEGLILDYQANYYFYKGIPGDLRRRVKDRMPAANRKKQQAPSVDQLLMWMRAEFDEMDIDAEVGDIDLRPEEKREEIDEYEEEYQWRDKRRKEKRRVAFEEAPKEKVVPAVGDSEQKFAEITKQLENLTLAVAEGNRAKGLPPVNNFPNPSLNQRRCEMCGESGIHQPGYRFCPEARRLLSENIIRSDGTGRYVCMDGDELPRAMGERSVAQVLRERKRISEAKGKGKEVPPHMASMSFAGLQFDGEDVFKERELGVSMVTGSCGGEKVTAFPVERTTKDDRRYDPKKRPEHKKDDDGGKSLTIKIPAPKKKPDPPAQNYPQAHQDAKRKAKGGNDAIEGKGNQAEGKMKSGPGYHFTSTVQEQLDADALQERILNQTMITMTLGEFLGASPEFQKRFNSVTKIRREYVNKPVTASIAGVLMEGEEECSCEGESDDEEAWEEVQRQASMARYGPVEILPSKVLLDYDSEDISEEEIEIRYASAVKLHREPVRLFAMVTGKFEGEFGGERVTFMVDTGSELNLCSAALYDATQLTLDLDGTRWSLKGIHEAPQQLLGCARDVPVVVGGHRFDHHFFVNEGGISYNQREVILGQPWLQWFTAAIQYNRRGGMTMMVWEEGFNDDQATLAISLTAPNATRNKDTLGVGQRREGKGGCRGTCGGKIRREEGCRRAYVEEVTDEEDDKKAGN